MCLEINNALSKEKIFEIMGNYYGNAHYRAAQRLLWSAHDLILISHILDTVNDLGYKFSNLSRLSDYEDIRFVPIIFDNYGKFENCDFNEELISSLCFKSYHPYTPELLELYRSENNKQLKYTFSNSLFLIRNKKYIPDYISIVTNDEYGKNSDMIIDILCKYRVPIALTVLIGLYEKYPSEWTFKLLRFGKFYRDPIIIPYLQELSTHDNIEYRSMANKALQVFEKNH